MDRETRGLDHGQPVWVSHEPLHRDLSPNPNPNPYPTPTLNQVSHEPLHRDLSVEARALLKTCLTSDAEARATAEGAQAHPWLK